MINILIPMSGPNTYDSEDYVYPKPLIELIGRPMIEHVVNGLANYIQNCRFIFVIKENDCVNYHLDNVLSLITDGQGVIVRLDHDTKGAACSALMAIDEIYNDDPLVISNSDHIIDYDLSKILRQFQERDIDAGTICFQSVHPKWSFVRLDHNGKIIETAEKRPLSRNAIAGFYYFKEGRYFVESAMKMIKKDANVNGVYYVAPTLNELVLEDKNLEIYTIPSSTYHNFYSPHKLAEYEAAQENAS